MLSFTIGKSSITVFLDGKINTIDVTHANHAPLLDELRKAPDERDHDVIRDFVTIQKMIERYTDGRVTVTELQVIFDGTPVADYLAQRMVNFLDDGIDIAPYAAFMANVHENPATYVHQELYEWLEKGNMPITPDGHFLAFKKVRENYTDCHTGKFDHSIGTIVEMDRNRCDNNRHRTCSTGFHFCSAGYLRSFGGQRVVVVKVNPRDVTSIPSDYQFTKGRCCRYEVIAELDSESAAHHDVWGKPVAILEDPSEYPEEVIKALLPGYTSKVEEACEAIEAEQTDAPKGKPAVKLTKTPDRTGDHVYTVATDDPRILATSPLARVMAANEAVAIDKGLKAPIHENIRIETTVAQVEKAAPAIRVKPVEIIVTNGQTPVEAVAKVKTAIERVGQTLAVKAGVFKPTSAILDQSDAIVVNKTAFNMLTTPEAEEIVFQTTDGRNFSPEIIKQALADASIRGAAKDLGIGESTLRGWKKRLGL